MEKLKIEGLDENGNGEGRIISYYDDDRDKKKESEGTFKDGKLNGEGVAVIYYCDEVKVPVL